jgi:CRISPR/Cas system CSM-associated protein Csm3 (group 7 of RAMP superfamily)
MSTEHPSNRYFHIARFTLEAQTALSISTGSPDGVFDSALVRDANGLPTIPGASLAGLLRHLLQKDTDEATANALFGAEEQGSHRDGWASRVQVAWGCILNEKGLPMEGLALDQTQRDLQADKSLEPLLRQRDAPLVRNRVRIGHRGAAADTGKFDRAILPAGYRFACELSLFDPDEAPQDWARLIELLRDPRLRLGGATRAGLGRMSLKALATRCFDLTDAKDAADFRSLGWGIGDTAKLTIAKLDGATRKPPEGWVALELALNARDFWRIGQGNAPIPRPGPRGRNDKEADALPVLEPQVTWPTDTQAQIALALPLAPGSAIKGALAHRTEFYVNCGEPEDSPRWADNHPDGLDDWDGPAGRDDANDNRHPAVKALFGFSKERTDGGEATGLAGRVFIDDVHITLAQAKVERLMHNAIDRFTGGVRDRLLFGEDLLWRTPIRVSVLVNTRAGEGEDVVELERGLAGLRLALNDLLEGRLALGAGSGKGHGYFLGAEPADLAGLTMGERS